MECRLVKVGELIDFVASDTFNDYQIIPISKHRAISQAANPRADSEDIALIVFFEEQQPIAYLGIVPDEIGLDGMKMKVGILSGLFVHEKYRGRGLAKKMVETSMQYYTYILGFDSSSEAFSLYKNMEEVQTSHLEGKRYFFKMMSHKWFARQKKPFKILKSILKSFDDIVNKFIKFPTSDFETGNITLQAVLVHQIDFTQYNVGRSKELFSRRSDEFLWIASFPWIIPEREKLDKYYFSAHDVDFISQWYQVNVNHKEIAHVMITIREGVMKISYLFTNSKDWQAISYAILLLVSQFKSTTLVCFVESVNNILGANPKAYLLKKSTMRTVMSIGIKDVKDLITSYQIHNGDADGVFT